MFDQARELLDIYERSNPRASIMYSEWLFFSSVGFTSRPCSKWALLSSARNHRQAVLSIHVYDRMRSLFPHQKLDLISAFLLLSNTYASVGEYQQARDVRLHRLKHFGKKTTLGVSWTEVNGRIFVSRFFLSRTKLCDCLA